MEHTVGKFMSPLIAGDPVIDDQHPVQILVVDPSGGADLVTWATRAVGEYFQITACNSLAQASDHLRSHPYDVIVLEPNLPDSWSADSYRRLSEVADEVPFLILTHVHDLGFLAQASPLPFALLAKDQAEPATIRRLLISAALHKRALTYGRDPGAQPKQMTEDQRDSSSHFTQRNITKVSQ
jgi:DNA-binding NarL/FixJ family response regulator